MWREEGYDERDRARDETERQEAAAEARRAREKFEARRMQQRAEKGGTVMATQAAVAEVRRAWDGDRAGYLLLCSVPSLGRSLRLSSPS